MQFILNNVKCFVFIGGLLSVIVDAYINNTLDDALIVPIAINYDKILDGNFIREQMGQNKVSIFLVNTYGCTVT